MATSNELERPALKAKLLQEIHQLDSQSALLPTRYPVIDGLIEALEQQSVIHQPLQADHWPTLLGRWQLIYASRGTVVTRRMAEDSPFPLPQPTFRQVWQTLSTHQNTLLTENGADLEIPFFGQLRLKAAGVWESIDEKSANVTFQQLAFQMMLGANPFTLPALTLPLPSFWQRQALWTTSYLDETLRVGRGATGNLFVFQRED